jgi:hypothetical protein
MYSTMFLVHPSGRCEAEFQQAKSKKIHFYAIHSVLRVIMNTTEKLPRVKE